MIGRSNENERVPNMTYYSTFFVELNQNIHAKHQILNYTDHKCKYFLNLETNNVEKYHIVRAKVRKECKLTRTIINILPVRVYNIYLFLFYI